MRNSKLVAIGLVVLAVTLALVAVVPYRSTSSFWFAFGCLVLCEVLAIGAAAFAPPVRDVTVWLPSIATAVGYFIATVVLTLVSNVLPWAPLVVLEVLALAAAAVMALYNLQHAEKLRDDHAQFAAEHQARDVPRTGSY